MKRLAYLDELVDYGGELRTRGSVIAELQKRNVPQKRIDAYMMGAKTIKPQQDHKFIGTGWARDADTRSGNPFMKENYER